MGDELGRRGRQVAQAYSWQRVADQISELYGELAPGAFGPSPSGMPTPRRAADPQPALTPTPSP